MCELYFKESYESILDAFSGNGFYIFGNTLYAHIFYLYCKEQKIEQNIKGFILSDVNKIGDNRKLYIMHGVPIKDIDWLRKNEKDVYMFLAAKEKTVHEQLFPVMKDELGGSLYYTGDFSNSIMYHYYMTFAYRSIITKQQIVTNPYKSSYLTITSKNGERFYNYTPKVSLGVLPDSRIFCEKEMLDMLYDKQLFYYRYIDGGYERYQGELMCKIYLTRSHFDKQLKEDFYTPFTEPIQVGADLTDIKIADLKDNRGENRSLRNQDYCEMSAVYWVWKNDRRSDYIGLCHYRRRFVIDANRINYIMAEKYDAVYAIPYVIDGGLREEFVERNYYITPEMWKLATDAIGRLSPEYLEAWQQLETSYFLLPCNMFIMRRKVFEDYCSWVFAVLEEVDRFYLAQGRQRNDRYLGYLAELLNTVYAMKHKDSMKKGYVYMKILECE